MHTFLYLVCSHDSVLDVCNCSSRVFSEAVLCFQGARRSSMMFPYVFVASRKVRALFFSAGSLLGPFQAGCFVLSSVLDRFVGLWEACFAPFLHR